MFAGLSGSPAKASAAVVCYGVAAVSVLAVYLGLVKRFGDGASVGGDDGGAQDPAVVGGGGGHPVGEYPGQGGGECVVLAVMVLDQVKLQEAEFGAFVSSPKMSPLRASPG